MNTPAPIQRLLVGYGSESGNARALAQQLGAHPALHDHARQVLPLNDIDVASLGAGDVLLAISSSFGDGDPPANGERFTESLRLVPALPGLRYAVFGLGDTGYPRFCGFTKALDALLHERQARPLLQRVDADAGYADFFERWAPVLGAVLAGNDDAGRDLRLQVSAYGEENAYAAPIVARRRLSHGDPAAWHVELDLRGSGMRHRAGDTLHVIPGNDPALLQALSRWYGQDEAAAVLADRELRLLSRTLLRELARLGGSEALKQLLRISQKPALEAYLQGSDLLDILHDHATPESVPLSTLQALLSPCLPRAYSIASQGNADTVSLCVREVRYHHRGRERRGSATGWLLDGPAAARVYCRSNPGFHLPQDPDCPVLLIGTGTGIAPLMGLVREMEAGGQARQTCLVFGEKRRQEDFLYREVLQGWQATGRLAPLLTAFSRDDDTRSHVQDALAAHASHVRDLLGRGAHVYLCGNLRLEASIQQAIDALLPADEHGTPWAQLQAQGRLHRELY